MSNLKNPTTIQDLKQRIHTNIDKLSDRSTLSQAIKELELIIKTIPSNFLSTLLSSLLSIDSTSKSCGRVHCINFIALIVNSHYDTINVHVPKIIVPALLRRVRDHDSAVRHAVATAVGSVSIVDFGSVLGPFLGAVIGEQEGNAQIGACVSLKSAIDSVTMIGGGDEAELRRVLPKLMKMVRGDGYKAKAALLGLIGSIVRVNNGGLVNGRSGLVGNVVGCAVEMLSSDDWAARKAAAEVLEAVVAVVEDQSATEFKGFVVSSLESRRFDKVKITRETMNRALDAWKDVLGGPEENLFLSRSNSSVSKDNGRTGSSPLVPRRSSFACYEALKPRKAMTKTRSSLSDSPVDSILSSISSSTEDVIGLETPQKKKTLFESKSLLSDVSTITDSSSISKSSHDSPFETPLPRKPTTKNRLSLPDNSAVTSSETRSNFLKTTSEEMGPEVRGIRPGSRVVPYVEEVESKASVVERGSNEEVGESNTDVEELSLIRNQLLQIERRQSNLMNMLQRFMGNSQSGIDSLETRVTGLERALDEISYDLGVQSGRIPRNDSPASTCCPSTEFLSPKFWRKTEGRSSMSKPSCLGNKDGDLEVLQMVGHRLPKQKEGVCKDEMASFEGNSAKTLKSVGTNAHKGRTCSPRSFDGASTPPPFAAPVIRGV